MVNSLSNRLPQQRISYRDKIKNKNEWGKNCVNAICFNSDNAYKNTNPDKNLDAGFISDYDRMLSNYRLYNNQINQADFERECDPFNVSGENFKDVIHPYNKAYNKINSLIGEEWKRPFGYMSILVNSEANNQYTRTKDSLTQKYVQASLKAEIEKIKMEAMRENPAPEQEGVDPKEYEAQMQQYEQQIQGEVDKVLSPEQIEKYMSTKWRPGAEIAADQILNILIRKYSLKKHKNEGFKHGLISGGEFVWVGVINGEPRMILLNPLKVFYHKSSEVEYIQDAMFAGYRTKMTIADILDMYQDELSDDDKDKLEALYNNTGGMQADLIGKTYDNHGLNTSFEWRHMNQTTTTEGSHGFSSMFDIDVAHVEWVSQRKVGFITGPDENGVEGTKMVDELYELPTGYKKVAFKDEFKNTRYKYQWSDEEGQLFELEWKWIPEVWEATKISGDIYVGIRAKVIQFRDPETFKVKLGYHGLLYNSMNAPNISVMDRMRPFQFLYFVTMHKMKQILAADGPPIINIDKSMIPNKLTHEQYMYYLKLGINFYDPNQNTEGGKDRSGSGQKATHVEDRSVMQHVSNYINILNALDEQIGEVAGVSKQREGQTNAGESATGTQTAVMNSTNVTELLFTAHNLLWETILTSLVEVASKTWGKNKKSVPFLLDDYTRGILELTPETFQNCDIGVFITDTAKDHEVLQYLRNLTQPMLQNNYKLTEVIEVLQGTSVETIKRQIKSLEDIREQLTRQQEEAQQQHEKDMLEREIESREDEQQHKVELQERKYDRELELASIEVYKFQKELDADNDGEPDFLAAQVKQQELNSKTTLELTKINANERNDRERMAHEEKMKKEDVKMAKEDNATKIKVAKLKPKPKPASKKK